MEEITKHPVSQSQDHTPAIGMIPTSPTPEPKAPAADSSEANDTLDKKELEEVLVYNELQARAQHLMDFVNEKRLTRAQLLAALLDR